MMSYEEEKTKSQVARAKILETAKLLGWPVEDKTEDGAYSLWVRAFPVPGNKLAYASFSYDRYPSKGRVSLCAGFAKNLYQQVYGYNEKHLSLTMSAEKSPEQMAADVKRRFVPVFCELAERAVKKDAQNTAYEDDKQKTLEAVKGGKLDEYEKGRSEVSLRNLKEGVWGTARYESNGQVKLEVSGVPVELAKKFLAELGGE